MDALFVVYQINSSLSASVICNINAYVSGLPLIKGHVTRVAKCNLHFTTKPGTMWENKKKGMLQNSNLQISCSSTSKKHNWLEIVV